MNKIFPFAANRKFLNIIEAVKPMIDVDDYNQKMLERDLNKFFDMVNLSDEEVDYYNISGTRSSAPPFEKFMNFVRYYSKENSHSPSFTWNSILRKLGYHGFVDHGSGMIHSAEPSQAVFLHSGAYQLVEQINRMKFEPDGVYIVAMKEIPSAVKKRIHLINNAMLKNNVDEIVSNFIHIPLVYKNIVLATIENWVLKTGNIQVIALIGYNLNKFMMDNKDFVEEHMDKLLSVWLKDPTLYAGVVKKFNKELRNELAKKFPDFLKFIILSKSGMVRTSPYDDELYDMVLNRIKEDPSSNLSKIAIETLYDLNNEVPTDLYDEKYADLWSQMMKHYRDLPKEITLEVVKKDPIKIQLIDGKISEEVGISAIDAFFDDPKLYDRPDFFSPFTFPWWGFNVATNKKIINRIKKKVKELKVSGKIDQNTYKIYGSILKSVVERIDK